MHHDIALYKFPISIYLSISVSLSTPTKFGTVKNVPNLARFSTTFDYGNISGMDRHIEIMKSVSSTTTPSTLGEKSW